MKVDPLIRKTFEEISAAAINSANKPMAERKEMRKLLHIFVHRLNDDERLFLFSYVMINMHYKNLLMDDDNLLKINNIKLRTVMFVFLLSAILLIAILVVFKQSDTLGGVASSVSHMLGFILSLE